MKRDMRIGLAAVLVLGLAVTLLVGRAIYMRGGSQFEGDAEARAKTAETHRLAGNSSAGTSATPGNGTSYDAGLTGNDAGSTATTGQPGVGTNTPDLTPPDVNANTGNTVANNGTGTGANQTPPVDPAQRFIQDQTRPMQQGNGFSLNNGVGATSNGQVVMNTPRRVNPRGDETPDNRDHEDGPCLPGTMSNGAVRNGNANPNNNLNNGNTNTLQPNQNQNQVQPQPQTSTFYAYTVNVGDSYAKISSKVFGDTKYTQKIVDANPSVPATKMKPGVAVKIPTVANKTLLLHLPVWQDGGNNTATTNISTSTNGSDDSSSNGNTATANTSGTTTTTTGGTQATKHKVAPGETISIIARKYFGMSGPKTVAKITAANKGVDPNKLRPGQELNIPASK